MNLCEEIRSRREAGEVRCGIRNLSYTSPEELAAQFNLRSEPSIYFEVQEAEALEILCKLLHQDMAYESAIMAGEEARVLAETFVGLFRETESRYYTNGNWHLPPQQWGTSAITHSSWTPTTDATFDGGILIIGEASSGCVWFEDED
jgi:hypothetical protein